MMRQYRHGPPFDIPTGNRFTEQAHIGDLIMEAYGLSDYEISGLPGWAQFPKETVYDIEVKAAGDGTPTPQQLEQMVQSLLADRFHLRAHREMKPDVPVYAVVVDKGGPKFHEFHKDDQAAPPSPGGPRPFEGTTIFDLARWLSGPARAANTEYRPVVDGTGLAQVPYDFDINKLLDFQELGRERRADPMAARDYMLTAVREKLGLKLEARKQSVEVLVIDHVEEPSEN